MSEPDHEDTDAPTPEELREQVERTRADLGRTVEALAAKADVKARARDKAVEVKEQAAAAAGEWMEQAGAKAAVLNHKAVGPAHRGRDRAPEPVRGRTAGGVRTARENSLLLVAAGALAVAIWLVRRRRA
ncbi:DUF3618 domain-containing protein [Streptomyces sp. NPDC097619]|uniref:DUF3618 domain-containing protein n=1 Tax=Streptomyces sp. NPDC097619 TaxID=3157228 RepID=UPI00332EB0A7